MAVLVLGAFLIIRDNISDGTFISWMLAPAVAPNSSIEDVVDLDDGRFG